MSIAVANAAVAGGMRLGLGGETVPAITLDSLNLTDMSVLKVGDSVKCGCHQQQLPATVQLVSVTVTARMQCHCVFVWSDQLGGSYRMCQWASIYCCHMTYYRKVSSVTCRRLTSRELRS
jgi:hypothetical protein